MANSLPQRELTVVGAGGHGRVVADAALVSGWTRVVATDSDPSRCSGELLPGVALRAPQLSGTGPVHVAIGDNAVRERVCVAEGRARLTAVVHPAASVSQAALVGAGSFVAAQAVVGPCAVVGFGAIINHGAVIDHDAHVGDFSHVAPNATLGGGSRVGRRVLVGAGAAVLPGLTVADDVVIGAGAVVNRSIAEAGTYAGAPARKLS